MADFGSALEALKRGARVRRAGWNGKGMFLFLVAGSTFQVSRPPLLGIYPEGTTINYCPHIDMKTADEKVVPWLASQTDVLADDWEAVDGPIDDSAALERQAVGLVNQYGWALPASARVFFSELAEKLKWETLKGALK